MSTAISNLLKELLALRIERKEIKRDIKVEEKIEREDYEDLKKSLKNLKSQVKDFEEEYMRDLAKMEDYQKLKEMLVLKEEEIGEKREALFAELAKLPKEFTTFDLDLGEELAKVEVQPAMRLFMNGKEEKPA